ncbi:hypothetical protein [Chitinophaga sp. YIM B06452]|uniref:hypothetical protein n=1 Tax=Chitinophaga sp. YIM B06452 TaxID=3082158 RepID=UPI0031FEF4B7
MSLPKQEQSRRRVVAAYKEMKAALSIALEKATIIENELGGLNPPPSQKVGLTPEQIAGELAKSRTRRNIPAYPNTNVK